MHHFGITITVGDRENGDNNQAAMAIQETDLDEAAEDRAIRIAASVVRSVFEVAREQHSAHVKAESNGKAH